MVTECCSQRLTLEARATTATESARSFDH